MSEAGKRGADHDFHDQETGSLVDALVEHADHARQAQEAQGGDLAVRPGALRWARRAGQELERDVLVEHGVASAPDLAVASLSEQVDEAISTGHDAVALRALLPQGSSVRGPVPGHNFPPRAGCPRRQRITAGRERLPRRRGCAAVRRERIRTDERSTRCSPVGRGDRQSSCATPGRARPRSRDG